MHALWWFAGLTLWLWKLAIIFSAVHLSAKAISAVTDGLCEITRQLNTGPEVGSRADWMSAAVVPGAKLLPTTTKGPEAPLMDRPGLGLWMVACPLPDSRAANRRSAFDRRLLLGLVGFEGLVRDRAVAPVACAGLIWFGREEVVADWSADEFSSETVRWSHGMGILPWGRSDWLSFLASETVPSALHQDQGHWPCGSSGPCPAPELQGRHSASSRDLNAGQACQFSPGCDWRWPVVEGQYTGFDNCIKRDAFLSRRHGEGEWIERWKGFAVETER